MELNEYQRLSERTQMKSSFTDMLVNASLGLSGESDEVVDHVKKHLFHGHELDEAYLVKELGDVLFYVSWLSTILGVSLSTVGANNVDKLRKRYPEGFSEEASKGRVE